ncbi:MAG: hypothetical protein BroJett040_20010 [Oligoflexia bacterium]|nr:MAG: hypothetical protein BroJett040_20010 [Oligoflexia bacterium]
MFKMYIIALVLFLTQFVFAEEHRHSFDHLKTAFQKAEQPSLEMLTPGWYAGRCFTAREPEVEQAGVIWIRAVHENVVQMIMPAGSIVKDVTAWNEIDEEELSILTEYSFIQNNKAAFMENASLVSLLAYDILDPVGKLFLRQMQGHYLLKMTEVYYDSEDTATTWFYCHFDKKVRD